MITFRPNRSTLAESMAEVVIVSDLNALMEHIRETDVAIRPETLIEISRYTDGREIADDERIGWRDLHIVEIAGHNGVLGFCTFEPVAVTP